MDALLSCDHRTWQLKLRPGLPIYANKDAEPLMSSTTSPQEKKRYALDRDHVKGAEYPHAFRKSWPRKRARINRAFRRNVRQMLQPTASGSVPEAAAMGRRERIQKHGVISVCERIRLAKLKRRAMIGAHKARRLRISGC
jgi:hypothetical protein